jgi:hypothetical protein
MKFKNDTKRKLVSKTIADSNRIQAKRMIERE